MKKKIAPMVKPYLLGKNSSGIVMLAEVCLDMAKIRGWDTKNQRYLACERIYPLSKMHILLFWFTPNQ